MLAPNSAVVVDPRPSVYGGVQAVAAPQEPTIVGTRLVLLVFLVVQVFDGLFTYVAVDALGIAAEGNRLLAALMSGVGPLPTLIGAKVTAAAGGLLLYVRGWHRVLALVTVIYALVAIAPWLVVYVSWGQ